MCGLPRGEGRALLELASGRSRIWLLAHDTDPLPPEAILAFASLSDRRRNGEPTAYIAGRREFMGHEFLVSPDVLIPRPDTELLVQTAIAAIEAGGVKRLADLGSGSGAIGISIALARPDVEVTLTDASVPALRLAQANAARLGVRAQCRPGHWYDALEADARYDLIVSNPPYIAADDAHLAQGDLRFEPRGALTDEADGMRHLYEVVGGAPRRLNANGQLWVEHGWDQARAVRDALARAGFSGIASLRDLAGIERISGGYL